MSRVQEFLETILPNSNRERLNMNNHNCLDCGIHTLELRHYYHVLNSVWQEEAKLAEDDGKLCLPCLEKRIKRPLTPIDFSKAPINLSSAFASDSAAIRILGKDFLSIREKIQRYLEVYLDELYSYVNYFQYDEPKYELPECDLPTPQGEGDD